MNIKKMLCLLMALLMLCTGFAETENDPQARIAELEQQLAEALALVDKYYPYFAAQVVAEFDGGCVYRDEVIDEYEYYESMYAGYGITLSGSSYEDQLKQDILHTAVEEAIQLMKAEELQLLPDQQALAAIEEEVELTIQYYIDAYGAQIAPQDATQEEVRQAVLEFLENNDYGYDVIYKTAYTGAVLDAIYAYICKDITVTDADIQAAYDAELAADQAAFSASSYDFEYAVAARDIVTWVPENYRAVKQVLISFDDEQSTRYDTISQTIISLESELLRIQNGTDTGRTAQTVQQELDDANAQLDALYAELMPRAQHVIQLFEQGESIDSLIETYGGDEGMLREPIRSTGYYVCGDYAPWMTDENSRVSILDIAFREAASSIENIGEISQPAKGIHGIYVVYYFADVTSGPVPVENVRDALSDVIYAQKANEAYSSTIQRWVSELNVVYYPENL